MSYISDSLLAIPISIVYYLIVEKMSNISFTTLPHTQRYNNRFIMVFVIGLITMIGSSKLIDVIRKDVTNNFIKYGLIAGGLALSTSATVSHWYEMNDQMKLSVFFVMFVGLLYLTHKIKQELMREDNDDIDDINDLIE